LIIFNLKGGPSHRLMQRFVLLIGIFALSSCSNQEKTIPAESLTAEAHHFFSNSDSKDYFALGFVPSDPGALKNEYTYFDILSGNLALAVYNNQHALLYQHKWAVSDCFSMADNHYLNEDQKIEKFQRTIDQFFDEGKFNSMDDIRITGVLRSSDKKYLDEIKSDPGSVGFSFIQEDFCVMYARKSHRAILLRALRKDILRRHNLAHYYEPADISVAQ
jgi:hypothetical protein